MANYNSFVFDGHGKSEADGSYDPGATAQGVAEHDLVTTINRYTREYLNKTSLSIHYDEQNFKDNDFRGNTYSSKAGISVHINAGGGTGPEIYVPLGEKYLQYDFQLVADIASALGVPNRGVKSRDYNSGNTIKRTNGVAVGGTNYYKEIRDAWSSGVSLAILEVGFIDTSDLPKMQSNARKIGYYIAKYICGICDVAVPPYTEPTPPKPEPPTPPVQEGFLVKVVPDTLEVYKNIPVVIKKNEVYTIVEVKGNFGKLKSGAGWIDLNKTKRMKNRDGLC